MRREFDYVIVGAGSAGCTLAYRLGAEPGIRVLVLEAGRWTARALRHIRGEPAAHGKVCATGL